MREKFAKIAAQHHSNLNAFGAIIAICEGGLFYGTPITQVQKIVKLAIVGEQRELKKYDDAIAKLKEQP